MPIEEDIKEITYLGISEGMKLSDNIFSLTNRQSPYLVNVDISRKGLSPRLGYSYQKIIFPTWVNIVSTHDFFDELGKYYIIAVSYPNIIAIDPGNDSWEIIYSKWWSDGGQPEADQSPETMLLVDGVNKPLKIDRNATTGRVQCSELTWPQALTNANNAAGTPGNIVDSPFNQQSSQQPADAGTPNHVKFLNDRFQLTDTKYRRRIWFSKISDVTDFSTNTPADWDIAFFIDLPTPHTITGWEVLNNEAVIIYLSFGYAIQSGKHPPGAGYIEPRMSWSIRNTANGLINHRLLVNNGEGDHFFFSNNGRLYSLKSSDNFDQALPKGLSEDIYPIFEKFDQDMWRQSILLNDQLRGELRLFCPSDDEDGYCTRCLIYKYSRSVGEIGWTQETFWGENFRFTDAHIDKVTNDVYVFNQGNRMLVANSGHNFDGNPVRMIAELRPESFGQVSRQVEILGVLMVTASNTGADITYAHRWNTNEEGLETVTTPKLVTIEELADYSLIDYNIVSNVGSDFKLLFFPITNRTGAILKQRIETNAEQDLKIDLVTLVYKEHGIVAATNPKAGSS